MRVLAAAVLSMESILMGFALLIAKDEASAIQIAIGGALAIALILNAGVLKRKGGYLLGSILQISLIGYGYVVSPMYYMGALFAGLWIAAFIVGRKGEAIRAELLRQKPLK